MYKKLIVLLAFAIPFSAQAFEFESGNYSKRSYNYDYDKELYLHDGMSVNQALSDRLRTNLKITNMGNDNLIATSIKNGTSLPYPIVINLSNRYENINDNALRTLKKKYENSGFAKLVKGVGIETLNRTNDELNLAIHFDLGINSVFGIVNNIRLTSEFSFKKNQCEFDIKKTQKRTVKEDGYEYTTYDWISAGKKKVDCIKMNSFKNTKITEFKTSLGQYDKIMGLAADVAVQLIFSNINVEEVLIKQ